jgi:NAD dependent epimerase/dehydratase family enzyme
VLAAEGIMFPAWQRDVPFTVVNRPIVETRGKPAVHANATWGDIAAIIDFTDGADRAINLASTGVDCRFPEANRSEILRSRVQTTRQLAEAIR